MYVWYMQYLQLWNTPPPSNPYLLWSGSQRRGTLSFTRMHFFQFNPHTNIEKKVTILNMRGLHGPREGY